MIGRFAALFVMVLMCIPALQGQDSTAKVQKPPLHLFSFADPHSPVKASIYAAVIPGLGQVYNRKYWKVPVVYASLGATTWFMLDQRSKMRQMNTQFRAAFAKNKDTTLDANDIAKRDSYRRYRDIAILGMTALYALQIVDAVVDAHFYHMDINQSLEASIAPNPGKFFTFTYHF